MKVRKIKIISWTEPSQLDPNKEVEVDTCRMIRTLISSIPIQQIPRGMEAFELFKELHDAFKDAENQEYLILSDKVFTFLEKSCFPHVLGTWGMMKEPSEAITLLVGAELVDIVLG
ncbi:hypothetical protein LCGC14_2066520 [marine sediment metagenome]|uniref:Uncharacterized protein n=1 Tax=marine sediment metagenome TaxID=412755 RepID=A0A0F9EJU7_9ZZZZ